MRFGLSLKALSHILLHYVPQNIAYAGTLLINFFSPIQMIPLTPRLQKAIDIAAKYHEGQKRKGGALPYIVHPFSVAWILSEYTDDEDTIIGGLLHDLFEDTPYTEEEMRRDFGDRVADMVFTVTDDRKYGESFAEKKKKWKERAERYLKHLKQGEEAAVLISAADKLQNLRSFLEGYEKYGEKFIQQFSGSFENIIIFDHQCLAIYQLRLQSPIVKEMEKVMKVLEEKVVKREE